MQRAAVQYEIATGRVLSFNQLPHGFELSELPLPDGVALLEVDPEGDLFREKDSLRSVVVAGVLIACAPPPPVVTAAAVKAEAERRILVEWPAWRQMNVLREADPAQIEAMGAIIDWVRATSNEIEAMTPIPADYRDDRYWLDQV